MKDMYFSIEINASKEKVWDTLWQDESFRLWAGIIDQETYMDGILKKGNKVKFISKKNGYGVTSLVEDLIVNELLLLRHESDTQDAGKRERVNEWTGGTESYKLIKNDGSTTLSTTFDVPEDMESYFSSVYPKALQKVKTLAEH